MQKHYAVNWTDGMRVNQSHFIEQQHAFTQRVLESAAARSHAAGYGLLPPADAHSPSCTILVQVENNSVLHLQLLHCHAITYGGAYIDLHPSNSLPAKLSAPLRELIISGEEGQEYLVAIGIDPYAMVPAGEPDPEETPLRYPYTQAAYSLSLLPAATVANAATSPFHLPLGKLEIRDGIAQLSGQYIPPCTSAYSYPVLADAHSILCNLLLKLEGLCQQIIHKILQKDQQYQLAQIVRYITEHILLYMNGHLYRFQHLLPYEPPMYIVADIAALAKTIKNAIDIRQGTGKEELLNYFTEWCDLNQAQFEQVIAAIIGHPYSHTDIAAGIEKSTRFLREITALYARLSELDYIGRKMEKNIFIKEEQVKEENPSKPRLSFWAGK